MNWTELEQIHSEGRLAGRQGVVGAVLVRPDGRFFAQRRSAHRTTFPGCWDLAGGHVEPGENLETALRREVFEETGWQLAKVQKLLKVVDWESPGSDGRPHQRREFVFVAMPQGDLESPKLEVPKVSEARWFWPSELDCLNENRGDGDAYVYDIVRLALGSP